MTPFVLVTGGAFLRHAQIEEKRMERKMPCTQAHPSSGKEVVSMDDVDVEVDVTRASVCPTSDLKERMSDHE